MGSKNLLNGVKRYAVHVVDGCIGCSFISVIDKNPFRVGSKNIMNGVIKLHRSFCRRLYGLLLSELWSYFSSLKQARTVSKRLNISRFTFENEEYTISTNRICIAKFAMKNRKFEKHGFALPVWQCNFRKTDLHCQFGNAIFFIRICVNKCKLIIFKFRC